MLAATMIGVGVGGAQASRTAWTVVRSPNVTLASGNIHSGSWTMQPFPVPASSFGEGLTAVSCTSPRFCEAVGSYFDNSVGTNVAEQWNRGSRQLQTVPSGATVNSVSCASAAFCEAVGETGGSNSNVVGVAVVWDGSAWSVQATSNPARATFTNLNAVSCVSPSSCEAQRHCRPRQWPRDAGTMRAEAAGLGFGPSPQ
jgi:hypothetical protein